MSGLQQVVPGGILHGDFLTGQAGKPCNVAAAAQDAQRAAVGVIKGKGRAGALGPGDVPQVAAVEPQAAAHGQVVVQGAAIVPRGGGTVQHQKVVKGSLGAGVGVQLRGAVIVQHPVGAGVGIVGKAGGAAGRELYCRLSCVGNVRIRQVAVGLLRQQGRDSGYGGGTKIENYTI